MAASTDELDRIDMGQLASGHEAALNQLMSRYAERLFHYLLRLLQNETEAADLAQETFVRVYFNRKKFKPAGKFSTWLYAIATNLARDCQRQRIRHPQVSLDLQPSETQPALHASIPESRLDPAETLLSTERGETVRLAVRQLPDELRLPLILSVYEEKSHAEIGTILECSAKAVEMRLYRARQQLRASLEKALALPQPHRKL